MTTQRGFSLVELMVSLVLSSMILLGLLNMAMRHKLNDEEEALEVQLQDRLNVSRHVLTDAIRRAGYVGCYNLDRLQVRSNGFGTQTMSGDEHLLKVAYADPDVELLEKDLKSTDEPFRVTQAVGPNTPLVLSDCEHADLFQSEDQHSLWIVHPTLQKAYLANAELAHWNELSFFIDKTSRRDAQGKSVFALYRKAKKIKSAREEEQEIADGITEMNLSYATDLKDFLHETSNTDFSKVKMVRVQLKAEMKFQGKKIQKEEIFFVTLRNRIV